MGNQMELLKDETDTSSTHPGAGGIGKTSDFIFANSDCAFGWYIETSE
jgi:hypothetical protein